MKRNEKGRLILCFAAAVILAGAFWFILRFFEEKMMAETLDGDRTALSSGSVAEEKEPVMGTLKLSGDKYDYYHEFETYLLIGTDASGSEKESSKKYQGNMADFLLLAVFDLTDRTYGMIQLNRDTITEITLLRKNNKGSASADMQLCTAHWYGGDSEASCENTVNAVSKMLGGITIDGYCEINMEDFPKLNHLVGGVEVTLENDFTKDDPKMKKGTTLTLTDEQAYLYIHSRMSMEDDSNTARMNRQKQYMKAYFAKALTLMKTDNTFINNMNHELEDIAVTNISGRQISTMTKILIEGESKGIKEFSGKSKIGQALDDGIDHVEFYIDKTSKIQVMTEMYSLQKRK